MSIFDFTVQTQCQYFLCRFWHEPDGSYAERCCYIAARFEPTEAIDHIKEKVEEIL